MNMLSRRRMMLAGSIVAGAAALSACATTHPSGGDISTKTALVATAVNALVAQLAVLGVNVPQNVLDQVNKLAADVQANADQIASGLDPKPLLLQIQGWVTTISNLLAPYYDKAPKIGAAVNTAIVLVVALLAELGVSTTAKAGMTSDKAATVLQGTQ